MLASVNSGRPPLTGGSVEVIVAFFEQSDIDAVVFSIAGVAAAKFAEC